MKLIVNDKEVQADVKDTLQRAVIISLLTWGRASESDDYEGSAYGWWGDSLSNIAGDKIGSKLWLLLRQKLTDEVVMHDTLDLTVNLLIDNQTTTIKLEDLINGIN